MVVLQQVLEGQQALQGTTQRLEKTADQIIENQAEVIVRLDHLDECVDSAKAAVTDLKADITKLETLIKSAVPDGDLDGHRLYHQNVMQSRVWWQKAKSSVVVKIFEWASVGFVGWLFITLSGAIKISLIGGHP